MTLCSKCQNKSCEKTGQPCAKLEKLLPSPNRGLRTESQCSDWQLDTSPSVSPVSIDCENYIARLWRRNRATEARILEMVSAGYETPEIASSISVSPQWINDRRSYLADHLPSPTPSVTPSC